MKMNRLEKALIRTSFRVYLQRRLEAPRVLGNLNLGTESRCLELGCGKGAGLLLISQYTGAKLVVGLDVDPDMLRSAREYLSHPPRWARNIHRNPIRLVLGDAARLAFAGGSFDGVFLFGVLDHIPRWREVVGEVYRVLKAGGVFSLEDYLFGPSPRSRWGHVAIGEAELREALEKSGFQIEGLAVSRWLSRCYVRARKPL